MRDDSENSLSDSSPSPSSSNFARDDENINPIFNDLPDNYLCGGNPTKMMKEALKELNVDDIRHFLGKKNHLILSHLRKKKGRHRHNII